MERPDDAGGSGRGAADVRPEGARGAMRGALVRTVRTAAASGEVRTLLTRVGTMIGARAGGTVLTLVYTLLLARVSAPADLGTALSALSVALLSSVLISLNVEAGSIRYLVQYAARGEAAKAAGFVSFNRRVVVLAFPLVLAALLAYAALADRAGEALSPVFVLTLCAAPVLALTRVYGRHAAALDRVLRGSLPRMLVRPALFTVVVGGVFLAGARVDAAFVMMLFLASALVTAAVQFALLRGVFAAAGGPRDTSPWRSWLGTGLALLPMIVMRENLRDLLIASAALGLAAGEVALFVIAIAVTGILTFSVKAVDLSFGPRVARAYADGHAARCRRLLAGGSGLKALIFLAGAAVLVAFRHDVLAIVGGEYVAASTAVVVLLLIPLAEALAGPVNILLNVSGHGRVILAVSFGGAAGIALATPVAGALHGVEAAALAAGACYLVHQLALLVMCWRRVGIDPSILSLRRVLARHHHGGRDGG